jgi:hypothetical protein
MRYSSTPFSLLWGPCFLVGPRAASLKICKPSGLFASFTKGLNEHPPILAASDNALPAVTSRHDMVHRALKLDSDLSRHPFVHSSTVPF